MNLSDIYVTEIIPASVSIFNYLYDYVYSAEIIFVHLAQGVIHWRFFALFYFVLFFLKKAYFLKASQK